MLVILGALAALEKRPPSLLDQALVRNEIAPEEIVACAKRLANYKGSYEEEFPLTTWEQELIAAGEPHKRTQFGTIRNMVVLARSCRYNSMEAEHELIVRSALALARSKQTDDFIRDFILAELSDELRHFLGPKMHTGIVREFLVPTLPLADQSAPVEPSADASAEPSEAAAATPAPASGTEPEAAPEQAPEEKSAPELAAQNLVDVLTGGLLNGRNKSNDLMNDVIHGSGEERLEALNRLKREIKEAQKLVAEVMKNALGDVGGEKLKQLFEGIAESVDASSLSVEARGAFDSGDFGSAEQLARRALSGLTGETSLVAYQRAVQLTFLAEIYSRQGKNDEAMNLLSD
ncbi:MAG: hypothetical protein ACRD3W_03730, partial [Terriglobales bacterium]